jgi:AraC-like DNA-binding protein
VKPDLAPIHAARATIDTCCGQPLDLAQLSRQAGFSRYHFIRAFRRAFGTTPHQYLTLKRIEKAKTLLIAGDISVTDVCFAVGFQSLGSFSALFSKHVGCSPQTYRAHVMEQRRYVPFCHRMMFGIDARPGGTEAE